MIVKIIQPFISAQAMFTQELRGMARFSAQLGPLVVAALTPDDFQVGELFDRGGWIAARRLFGEDLPVLLEEMNEVLTT